MTRVYRVMQFIEQADQHLMLLVDPWMPTLRSFDQSTKAIIAASVYFQFN